MWATAGSPGLRARLADRQRRFDLRAAGRVAAATRPLDPEVLTLLSGAVRGGPVPDGQIEQAMATVDAEEPPPVTSAGMVLALTRLAAGKTDAIAFVEIGPHVVALQTLVVDSLGFPDQRNGEIVSWPEILSELPDNIGLRYLRMAGGVGAVSSDLEEGDAPALCARVGYRIRPVLTRFKEAAAKAAATARAGDPDSSQLRDGASTGNARHPDIVLVRRTHNWPVLDEAAVRARAELRPIAEIMAAQDSRTLTNVVDDVAARVPLRYGCDLVAVEAGRRTGIVRPVSRELFPAGAAALPGEPLVRSVGVSPVPGHAAKQVVLPVVVNRGPVADLRDVDALRERRPLVAMAEFDATTAGSFRLRADLVRPGLVRLSAPPEVHLADSAPETWPGLMAGLPERLESAPSLPDPLDLVLLVELGAAKAAKHVEARLRLVSGVVRIFCGMPEVKIAVLGYRDHLTGYRADAIGMSGQEREALVVGSIRGFSAPEEARSMLQSVHWRAAQVGPDHAAPLEEALGVLMRATWKWRADARQVVIIIGRRPPHPPKPDGVSLACPNGKSWKIALERLRQRHHALRCIAVLDELPQPGYAAMAWQALTAQGGLRTARGTSPERLAIEDCGLIPGSPAQLHLATLTDKAPFPATGQEGR
jgi:hypothetical protein